MSKALTYWRDLGERAVATAAEAAVAAILAGGAMGLADVAWQQVAGIAGLAGVMALLKGLAASHVGDPTSAGLVDLRK
jgi:hypothetical protein